MSTDLYRIFDADGTLLYVGITNDVKRRCNEHRLKQRWGNRIASVTVTPHDTKEAAQRAEMIAIGVERPRHNVMHAPQVGLPEITRRIADLERRIAALEVRYQVSSGRCVANTGTRPEAAA